MYYKLYKSRRNMLGQCQCRWVDNEPCLKFRIVAKRTTVIPIQISNKLIQLCQLLQLWYKELLEFIIRNVKYKYQVEFNITSLARLSWNRYFVIFYVISFIWYFTNSCWLSHIFMGYTLIWDCISSFIVIGSFIYSL